MTNLPQIQPHSELIDAVNARELHAFLQNKRQFSDWIKQRIAEYDFVKNQDFICVSQICETQRADGQRGITTKNEYYITLDMAKQLSMVERNEQGKKARRYFIECERIARQVMTASTPVRPTSPTLSPTDWATIRRAVLIIANGMYYKQQAINAIYGRLRNLCGVDSVTQIRCEHLPLIQSELYRIERTLSVYKNQRRQIEQKLIRRVCLDDADIIAESVVEIEQTAHAYAQKFDEAASAISTARYITKCVEGNGDA